jgi:hypothetical protein
MPVLTAPAVGTRAEKPFAIVRGVERVVAETSPAAVERF